MTSNECYDDVPWHATQPPRCRRTVNGTDSPSPSTTTTTKMTDRRALRVKPQADMNLVNLSDRQYCETDLESEHQDDGPPVSEKSKKNQKRKTPVTPDAEENSKRLKAQQGGSISTIQPVDSKGKGKAKKAGPEPMAPATTASSSQSTPQEKGKAKLSQLEVAREFYIHRSTEKVPVLNQGREKCEVIAVRPCLHPISSATVDVPASSI
jgi:hypothetical protein